MGQYNWIDGKDFSIKHFYLMDRWLLEMIFMKFEHLPLTALSEHHKTLGTLLKKHVDLPWFISKKAPLAMHGVKRLIESAYSDISDEELRERETALMEAYETDVVYTEPSIMDAACNYITAWDKKYLFELADFEDKLVLDVGAGTGRLTFAAAERAKRVYASEPVDQLRLYMRDKIERDKISNVKVLDGVVMNLPYEDSTFDVVMCGHVVGDNYDAEIDELIRVTKPQGMLVICNGDDDIKRSKPDSELLKRGFTSHYHQSKLGGDIYNYTKGVKKNED